MKKVSFGGIGEVVATFYAGETVKAGQVVKMSGDSTVAACAAGDGFCGAALSCECGCAGVQVKGFLTLPYSGDAPAAGPAVLAADGAGGVKTAETGVTCTVIGVDAAAGQLVILL